MLEQNAIIKKSKETVKFPNGKLSILGIGMPRSLPGDFPENANIVLNSIEDNVMETRKQPKEDETRILFSGIITFTYNEKKYRAIVANALFMRLFDAITEGNLNDMQLTLHSSSIPDSDRKGVETIIATVANQAINLMERHGSDQNEEYILNWRRENGFPVPGSSNSKKEEQPEVNNIIN